MISPLLRNILLNINCIFLNICILIYNILFCMLVMCYDLHGKGLLHFLNLAFSYSTGFRSSYYWVPFNRQQPCYKCMCTYLVEHYTSVWGEIKLFTMEWISLKRYLQVRLKLFVHVQSMSVCIIIICVSYYKEPEHVHWYLELVIQSSIVYLHTFIYYFTLSNTFMHFSMPYCYHSSLLFSCH